MNRLERRRRWEQVIEDQAGSGVSVAEFCRENDLSPASFYQWRKRLRVEGSGEHERFVPVTVLATAGVIVELPCGAVLRLPGGGEQVLAQVLSRLLAAGGNAE